MENIENVNIKVSLGEKFAHIGNLISNSISPSSAQLGALVAIFPINHTTQLPIPGNIIVKRKVVCLDELET